MPKTLGNHSMGGTPAYYASIQFFVLLLYRSALTVCPAQKVFRRGKSRRCPQSPWLAHVRRL